MSVLSLRILVFGAGLGLVATVAWALPADEARPSLATAAPSQDTESVVAAPARIATSARIAAPTSGAPIPTTTLAAVVPADADHLTADEPAPVVEPVAVVTTTTSPPPTVAPPTTLPAITIAFTATQAYGSCGEDVPYDIFSGRATPGTTVSIRSPYGSGSTTVGANGHWERRVEFPSAPRGETFTVTARGLGGSATLHFTATGGAEHV